MRDTCKICGKHEDAHHRFVRKSTPVNCTCDLETWDEDHIINQVCDKYDAGLTVEGYCRTCSHDRACHKE